MYAFLRFPNFRNKAVTLSYDDGVDADARLIDIMQRYGLKGTFNINSGLIGNSKKRTHTVKELTELYLSTGNEVAVHGVKHLSLPNVDIATATREILDDRAALEQQFGGIIRGMAYAYGQYNDDVVNMLRACGIVYARTVVSTKKFNIPTDWLRMPATCHHNDPELFSLLDKFLSPATGDGTWAAPRLFYLWGHSYEFDDRDNWQLIEEFAARVGGREDVWYATNGEIYDYVAAFKSLIFSADGNTIHNPTATDVYLNYYRRHVKVEAGKTVILK